MILRRVFGETHPSAKLTNRDVIAIRQMIAHGVPIRVVAARHGISITQVRNIVTSKNWKHI